MRNLPVVTKNLLIINVLVFLASLALQPVGIDLTGLLGLHFFLASDFQLYQLFTYMFMHGGFMHLFMNMFMLWMFGMVIENVWGARKFLFFYIVCGLGAGVCQELTQFVQFYMLATEQLPSFTMADVPEVARASQKLLNLWTTVGASGSIYAVLLAFGMLFPNERMFIIPIPVPIKAKWVIAGSIAVELFSAIGTSNDGVAHLAHLGGMLFGFILIKYWRRHPYAAGGGFGAGNGRQFFDRMRNNWERQSTGSGNGFSARKGGAEAKREDVRRETDWEYNARKEAEQAEIDRILDKIRKSGYDSLSKDEKQRLFDSSKN